MITDAQVLSQKLSQVLELDTTDGHEFVPTLPGEESSDEDIENMNKQMSDEGEGQEDDTEEEQPTEEKFELKTVAQ